MLYTRIFELTILENIKNPDETFGEIWKILRPREKHSEILSLKRLYQSIPSLAFTGQVKANSDANFELLVLEDYKTV